MNVLKFLVILVFVMTVPNIGYGQGVKVGHTNIELVMAYMPDVRNIENQLTSYQKKLSENIKVKQDYAQSKLTEYQKQSEAGGLTPATQKTAEDELVKLDQEINKMAADAEQQLMQKREELLAPILEKLQKAIDKVAIANGFTYILNQTTGTGVSTILFGPDENDITELLMKELGIPIPTN